MTNSQPSKNAFRPPFVSIAAWQGSPLRRWYLAWKVRVTDHNLAHLQSLLDREFGSADMTPILSEYSSLVRERNILARQLA